ncbi:MAG: acetate/propionate family kinase [Candidatus Paceibacterota bacterium]|jgi:acetate kinase
MILVLNCGSQSVKYKLFDNKLKSVRTGKFSVKDKSAYAGILDRELKKIGEVEKVCHRVVHGGEKFRDPIIVDKKVLAELKKYNNLAPLHNPFNVLGIEMSLKVFPKAEQVAVFDTGFYKNIPEKAYQYALPEDLRNKYGFRRYGFHGISHEYAAREAAKKIGKEFEDLRIISCHLGGGASITAIKEGRAVDTSMGFTPLEGLVMMTRSGNLDPGIILQLGKELSFEKLGDILNKESGLKGICGESEMLDVLKRIKEGNKKAKLALDIFVYSIQKYIGSYFGILGSCDLLVFTGSIGSGSSKIRNMIINGLSILNGTKVLSVETDEELMIAKKSQKL